jgi:hypothetical protein
MDYASEYEALAYKDGPVRTSVTTQNVISTVRTSFLDAAVDPPFECSSF